MKQSFYIHQLKAKNMDTRTALQGYLESIKNYIISDKKSATGFRHLVLAAADFIMKSKEIPENEKKIIGEGFKNEIEISPELQIGDDDDLSNATRNKLTDFKYFRVEKMLTALIGRLGNSI